MDKYEPEFLEWLSNQPDGFIQRLQDAFNGKCIEVSPRPQKSVREAINNSEIYNFGRSIGLDNVEAHKTLLWRPKRG